MNKQEEHMMSAGDALRLCRMIGEDFVHDYQKAVKERSDEIYYDMQTAWDKVKDISFTETKELIPDGNLLYWFFYVDTDPKVFFRTEKELTAYKVFSLNLLNNRENGQIKDILVISG